MCQAALIMKRTMKMTVMGTSTPFSGAPPSAHVVGANGPDPLWFMIYHVLAECSVLRGGSHTAGGPSPTPNMPSLSSESDMLKVAVSS